MKVHTLIFAGGVGRRMHANGMPKQFLQVFGKPIIIHTLEHFQQHRQVDNIVLVCVQTHLESMQKLLNSYGITKVSVVVPGGETGQQSICIGLQTLADQGYDEKDIVLIHDGVRPCISEGLITENIRSVKKYGSAISAAVATETFCLSEQGNSIKNILPRAECLLAKAPQSFFLGDILSAHRWAVENKIEDAIDSADLMQRFGHSLHYVQCASTNIKITHPVDFYIFKGILNAVESMQIIGM